MTDVLLSLRLPFLSFLRGWVDVKTTQAYKYGRHAVKKSAQVKLESFASRVFFLSLSFFLLGRKKESEHFFSDLVTVRKKKQVKKEKSFKREDSAKNTTTTTRDFGEKRGGGPESADGKRRI